MTDSAVAIKSADCRNCGAPLLFDPAAQGLSCRYCGHVQDIPVGEFRVRERDYVSYVRRLAASQENEEVNTAECPTCSADITLPEDVEGDACPYCGVQVALEPRLRKLIRPRYILPFLVPAKRADAVFRRWIKGLWFAPRNFKKQVTGSLRLQGIYVPYWTYDALTSTHYTGQRGEHYWVTEHYTAFERGKHVRRTRQVRKTHWYPASGTVSNAFDDVLVCASRESPADTVSGGGSWDLENLLPMDDDYLRGFRVESYRKALEEGFAEAGKKMLPHIRMSIRQDIGGDEQSITSMQVGYRDITFKHILVPVWVSAYTYRRRLYRFAVNGRTGRLSGSRPWSIGWIVFAVVAVSALFALLPIVLAALRH